MNSRLLLTITLLLALGSALHAESLEFTPFLGYQAGGRFEDSDTGVEYDLADAACAGAILDIDLSEATQVEFYFSRQETEVESEGLFPAETFFDLDIDYYHIGGTFVIVRDTWQPFAVGTLGVTHMSPEPSSIGSLTRFSVGFGGGVRYFPTEHLGLYLAGRAFFTFIDSDTHIRVESGHSTVNMHAEGLWQGMVQAGLILRF